MAVIRGGASGSIVDASHLQVEPHTRVRAGRFHIRDLLHSLGLRSTLLNPLMYMREVLNFGDLSVLQAGPFVPLLVFHEHCGASCLLP